MKWRLVLVGACSFALSGCLPDVVPPQFATDAASDVGLDTADPDAGPDMADVGPDAMDDVGEDAGVDASDTDLEDASDMGEDAWDAPPECTDAPECASPGLFCGNEVRQRFRCQENAQGCLELVPEECPLGSLCDEGKCVDCTQPNCQQFQPGEVINCITVPEDVEPQYATCRPDPITGCVVFEIAQCELEQECMWSGQFEDPCVDDPD